MDLLTIWILGNTAIEASAESKSKAQKKIQEKTYASKRVTSTLERDQYSGIHRFLSFFIRVFFACLFCLLLTYCELCARDFLFRWIFLYKNFGVFFIHGYCLQPLPIKNNRLINMLANQVQAPFGTCFSPMRIMYVCCFFCGFSNNSFFLHQILRVIPAVG